MNKTGDCRRCYNTGRLLWCDDCLDYFCPDCLKSHSHAAFQAMRAHLRLTGQGSPFQPALKPTPLPPGFFEPIDAAPPGVYREDFFRRQDFFTAPAQTYTVGGASTADVTFESLKKVMDQARAMRENRPADVVVMTRKTYRKFLASTTLREPGAQEVPDFASRIAGMEVEAYDSMSECRVRAAELVEQGRKVMLIEE